MTNRILEQCQSMLFHLVKEKKKKAELLLMKGVWKKAIDEINDSFKQLGKPLIS